jgi:excisionase family DNA binding protein
MCGVAVLRIGAPIRVGPTLATVTVRDERHSPAARLMSSRASRRVRIPLSTQASGIPGHGKGGDSHPVASNGLGSKGSFTFSAQDSQSVSAYLTVAEVAAQLRVCRAAVYRMIDEGRLPAVKVSSGALRVPAGSALPSPDAFRP